MKYALLPALAVLATLGLCPAQPAAAQNYFPNDATINYALTSTAIVGRDSSNNPSNPTVSLVNGGSISGGLQAFNASTVYVTGGSISFGELAAFDSSTLSVSGGSINSGLYAANHSIVTITGGTFGQQFGLNFRDTNLSTFTFVGTGLLAVAQPGLDPTYGGTDYLLTGLLQNGQSITGNVINVQPGTPMFTLINAAPEPSPWAALAVGTLGVGTLTFRARRRALA